jgi:hypothetical protein
MKKVLLFVACLFSMNVTKPTDYSIGASNNVYIPTGQFTEVMNLAYIGCFQGMFIFNKFYAKPELCSGVLVGKFDKNAFLYETNPIIGLTYNNFFFGVGPSFNFIQNIYTTGIKSEVMYAIPFNQSRFMLGITDSVYFESKILNMLGFSASVMMKI